MRKLMIMAALVALFVAATAAYASTIQGTSGNDNLSGTPRHDVIKGGSGNDTLKGLAGTDDLNGGIGSDTIWGGPGEDFLRGHRGNDVIHAGDDKDTDEIRGGAGYDVAYVSGPDHSANNITGVEKVVTEAKLGR